MRSGRSSLKELEAESIHILREVAAEARRPVLLYSVGKDSSVLLRLSQKAFAPGRIPYPLLHVDTGFKFPEMYDFRDEMVKRLNLELHVYRNEDAISRGANPLDLGTQACCGMLKTSALLQAIKRYEFDMAIGGARRDEERSRAKERIFSLRNSDGGWDPKHQRPELWNLYNTRMRAGEQIRVFPLSNWTELEIWQYIESESIPVVPLYFASERRAYRTNGQIVLVDPLREGAFSGASTVTCRFRSLGCVPCTGAIESNARSVSEIIAELRSARTSERSTRVIDHDQDASMEAKKREGYF